MAQKNETVHLGTCPRCDSQGFEHLSSYAHCVNCGYVDDYLNPAPSMYSIRSRRKLPTLDELMKAGGTIKKDGTTYTAYGNSFPKKADSCGGPARLKKASEAFTHCPACFSKDVGGNDHLMFCKRCRWDSGEAQASAGDYDYWDRRRPVELNKKQPVVGVLHALA